MTYKGRRMPTNQLSAHLHTQSKPCLQPLDLADVGTGVRASALRPSESSGRVVGWLALALLVVTSQVALHASAQGGVGTPLELGHTALQEGRYRDAVTHLDTAYRAEPKPETLYRLAQAYEGLAYPGKAIRAYKSFVEYAGDGRHGEMVSAAEASIERLSTGFARFSLTLSPDSARIEIDGKVGAIDEGELWVNPGRRHLVITAPKHEPYEQYIDAKTGRFALSVNLRQPSGTPQARAEQLLNEGDQQLAGGNATGATASYGVAQRVWASPRGAGSLGLAQEAMGEYPDAEANISKALRSPSDPWVRANNSRLLGAKARLEGALATLQISGPAHAGAEVLIDGRPVGTLPLPDQGKVRVKAGQLVVMAKQERFEDYHRDLNLPARGLKPIVIAMTRRKVVPIAAIPVVAPKPAPAATQAAAVSPAAATAAAPAAAPPATAQPEESLTETSVSASDIEAMVSDRDAGTPPEEYPAVSGLEMGFGLGLQFWLDEPEGNASTAFAARLFSIGYRPFWPISFGIRLLDAHYDLGTDARAAFGAAPTIYVRGHSQRDKKAMTFDFWGGLGLQPVAFTVATYEANETVTDFTMVDAGDAANLLAEQAGIGDTISIQSVNIPIEVGGAFYLTSSLAVEVTAALNFWLQSQQCYWDANDRVCFEDGLETLKSFYLGAGLSFLP